MTITRRYRSKIKSVSLVLQQQMSESESSSHLQLNVGIMNLMKWSANWKKNSKTKILEVRNLKFWLFFQKGWGIHRIEKELHTLNWLAWKAKELVIPQGILSSPIPQPCKARLAKCLEDTVNTFYDSDKISCTMPGKKDLKSTKKDGKWIYVQKRLITGNLKKIFNKFKKWLPRCSDWLLQILWALAQTCNSCWSCWNSFCLCMCSTSEYQMYGQCNQTEWTDQWNEPREKCVNIQTSVSINELQSTNWRLSNE
jgi:hypothetical protein